MSRQVPDRRVASIVPEILASGGFRAKDFPDLDPLTILDELPIGILLCEMTAGGGWIALMTNARADAMLGGRGPGADLLGRFREACRSGRVLDHEMELGDADTRLHVACRIAPFDPRPGPPGRVLCTLIDRTADKRTETSLLHHALHDPLTGLANRSLFQNRLEESVADCLAHRGKHCALLLVNVDRFQLLNETFGHQAGDAWLIGLADRLRAELRPGELLGRIGADEFAILMTGIGDAREAEARAKEVHGLFSRAWTIAGTEAWFSACIGVATTLDSRDRPESLIRNAGVAMRRAKSRGRARTGVFSREEDRGPNGQIALESALRRAIEAEALELHYQPVLDLASGRTVAFEALCRWNDPDRGAVSPAEFIPVAEDSGLIVPLGRWCLEQACRQLAAWRSEIGGLDDFQVNVNLSAVQFLQDDIAMAVAGALRRTDLEGRNLRLEITESVLMADPDRATATLCRIKDMGPTLALDDFGTGFSSLNYLSNFPLDCIKIDRSFISRIDRDTPATKIVRLIAMLAETLGMSVVAEGIENEVQLAAMREVGCGYGQGYLFSRPLPVDRAADWLRRQDGAERR